LSALLGDHNVSSVFSDHFAGLDCLTPDGRGILVDTLCRSSDPSIHAIGDVAAFPIADLAATPQTPTRLRPAAPCVGAA